MEEREGGLEAGGVGPVRFRAGQLTRWRAGRVGSAFHRLVIARIYNAQLTLLYPTPTPTYSHFYSPFYCRDHIHSCSDSYLSMPSLYSASSTRCNHALPSFPE